MKQLRALLESIVFAGVKSDVGPSWQPHGIDRLNLSHRTFAQKTRAWLMPALQCLVLISFILILVNLVRPTSPPKEVTPDDVSRQVLPNLPKPVQVNSNRDLEVLEVHLEGSPGLWVTGSVRNHSAENVETVEVAFLLTNSSGSQVGYVTARFNNFAAKSVKSFRLPIESKDAARVMVREINSR